MIDETFYKGNLYKMRGERELATILEGHDWVVRGSKTPSLVYENVLASLECRSEYRKRGTGTTWKYTARKDTTWKDETWKDTAWKDEAEPTELNLQKHVAPQEDLETEEEIILASLFLLIIMSIAMIFVGYILVA